MFLWVCFAQAFCLPLTLTSISLSTSFPFHLSFFSLSSRPIHLSFSFLSTFYFSLLQYLVKILYRPATANTGNELREGCCDLGACHHQTSVPLILWKSFQVPKESSSVGALRKGIMVRIEVSTMALYLFCIFVACSTWGAELFIGLKRLSTQLAGEATGHAGLLKSHNLRNFGHFSWELRSKSRISFAN